MMVSVREFCVDDLKRVFEIESMSFSTTYEINLFKQLHDSGAGFLVAEKEGYVIGYILFWIKYENQGHIISLAVDKNYRRQKVGTKLLSRAIQVLMMCDIYSIYLEVDETNLGAVEFYKGFNFQIDRIVPHYYDNGNGAVVMYLPIIKVSY